MPKVYVGNFEKKEKENNKNIIIITSPWNWRNMFVEVVNLLKMIE